MTGYVVRPWAVAVDGVPVPAPVRSVRVATRLGRPTQCEVLLDACHPPALGSALRVGAVEPLFDGDLTAVEFARTSDGSATVRLRGYDRLHRLRKRGGPRVFVDESTVDIVRALAGDLGLAIDRPAGADVRLDRVVQHGQRDFDLLLELTSAVGLHPQVRDGTLHLVSLAGIGDPVPLRLGGSLHRARVEANLDRAAVRYTALGWHPQRAEPLRAEANTARSGRRNQRPIDVGGAVTLVNQPSAGLAGRAQAALDESVAHALTVDGIADGDPRLAAGQRIALTGVDDSVDGEYVLTESVHIYDASGFRTEFSTRPPAPVPAPGGTELALGRVTAVDDPESLGRVRVELPGHGDVDAGWLAVLVPGAGSGRGLVMLPDVGDTVAVALPHGRPADGIVLGSLFGTIAPPDSGVRDGAVRAFTLGSAAGQRVRLDDERRLVRVDNADGSFLELAPDAVRLHAAADLVIDAAGHALTIRANSVDFEHAEAAGGGA